MAVERWHEFADEDLVVAALLGEIAAFDVLVLRYRPAVLAAVSRQISQPGGAEDICQEAFLLAFKALPQLSDPGRFGGWLHAIARRQAIRQSRGEARRGNHVPIDALILEHSEVLGEPAWDALIHAEEQAEIRRTLASLPEEFQLVIQLRYWAEMPLERIAAFLDLPLSTIKWRLHRARALMRDRLTDGAASSDRKLATESTESTERMGKGRAPIRSGRRARSRP